MNDMEMNLPTQLHYFQFASLYQRDARQLKWRSVCYYVLDLELCFFGIF